MSPERFQQIEQIFFQALEQPAAARPAFLSRACAADSELRREVELLLASDSDAKTHIGGVVQHVAASLESTPPVEPSDEGQKLGPYLLVREIGRGGMGVVYQAIRNDGEYLQAVAIKLVRHGLGGDQILKRFRAERQILATLQHPNIASLLDGGTTPDGRPYLVMEFIEGMPLLQYAAAKLLSTDAKIAIFLDVCAAVQHAHQKGVIHRDIKPGNILVTKEGVPKLLDFGVAKLLNPDMLGEGEPLTRTGVRIMTPAYASPEQICGGKVSPASDVYSLGAILYELIGGQRMGRVGHGFTQLHIDAMLRAILTKAVHENPAERYPTVLALAEDLRRYLNHEPLLTLSAPIVSPVYRRYAALAAVVLVTLAAGFGLSKLSKRPANDTRDPEVRSLTIRALDLVRKDPSVREKAEGIPPNFQQAMDLLEEATRRDPQYAAAWSGLGHIYEFAADMDPHRAAAWTSKAKQAGQAAIRHDPDQADAHALLAGIAFYRDWDLMAAERSYKRSIDLNPRNAYAIQEYADLLRITGRVEQAITEVERAISLDASSPRLRVQRGLFFYDSNKIEDCLEETGRALQERPTHPEALWLKGLCLERGGQLDDAERTLLEVLKRSPADGRALPAIGHLYGLMGRRQDAERVLAQLEQLRQRGKRVQYGMALVYAGLGDIAPALYWLHQSFEMRDQSTLYAKVEYRFRPLRSEPGFQELLRKVRLIR